MNGSARRPSLDEVIAKAVGGRETSLIFVAKLDLNLFAHQVLRSDRILRREE